MFSVQQKRDISTAVQKVLRDTAHPELPVSGEISFNLKVVGAESWSYAEIKNNASVGDPGVNPHNELMDSLPPEDARELLDVAKKLTSHPPMPDPRNTPEEFFSGRWLEAYKEMVKAETAQLVDRMNSLVKAVKGFAQSAVAYETRIGKIEAALGATADSDANALMSLPDRMSNLETAVRQLGNAQET